MFFKINCKRELDDDIIKSNNWGNMKIGEIGMYN